MYRKETIVLEEVTGALFTHMKMKQDGDGSQTDGLIAKSESSNRGRTGQEDRTPTGIDHSLNHVQRKM